ncbi:unnamed protein product [Arabidopsis lyrata]|uniref:Uncharacterized protein n=1 Tax=Arabidopsis lyrata subsp. lyrata TaxID=81972 RepID=D7KMD3_ARALL|nr:uncharacterized protein LOC9328699 [Arabidopsis lyrata subsp. lyrata]EFH66121.1 hypothetical protein ARALYDRAFT_471268 [Arabidopsis lyrata subsp. lyrata]CAH8251925.1 unnamed protein product [Arabidopsis lyrata]|eukprot:XP_002889862.1 uncharacterized protein LOC9328699 [Arabidopsis lyrata subsp. lyrata]
MDPIASVLEKVKSFTKSSQDLVSRHFGFHENPSRQNPIDILKRLQREAFSDLMKLRDRQEKVERIISSQKLSKSGPFQETSTHVRGEVDVLGAILLMGNTDDESFNGLHKEGVRPGLLSRFVFETSLRETDRLVAELVAGYKGEGNHCDFSGRELSLAKVFYEADINDWFSAVAIPVGAHFRDIEASTVSSYQGMSLTEVSELGPPLLNQHNGSAIGLIVRKSNITASLAQSMSNVEVEQGAPNRGFRTFGQVTCHILRSLKISLLGCHQVLTPSSNLHSVGAITLPVSFLRRHTATEPEPPAPPLEMSRSMNHVLSSAIALKLDSLMDESTKLGGWIEIQNSREKQVKWSVSITDNPEDEVGWGMSVGGVVDSSRNHDRFQVESYLKFNIGDRFSLRPGLVYHTNSNGRTIGLMLQSHWSL